MLIFMFADAYAKFVGGTQVVRMHLHFTNLNVKLYVFSRQTDKSKYRAMTVCFLHLFM